MIRAFVLAIFMFIMPAFAEEAPALRIFVYPDVLEYAINKHFSVMDRDRAAQEWENRMFSDGSVTAEDIRAVCKAGRIDDAECNAFQKDVMTYFYSVCEKSADKGKSDCVKDFWAAAWGAWVRLPEAIGISKEYALVKNNETVVCSTETRDVNPPARASYVRCTSVDGGHYYEYKYNSTTETNDRDILSGTLRAVGKIHGIEFQNADCTLERIYSDSNCALSYKTSDAGQCEKINKSLNRFGYSSKVITSDKFGKRCEVFGISGGNRTAYGIDNTVFKDVQVVYGPDVEQHIKDYVVQELARQNIKLESFSCDASTKHVYGRSDRTDSANSHDEVVTCYVNGQPVDFLFDDLSEGKGWVEQSGLSKMACAKIGGKIDGRDCRGLGEIDCAKLSAKIPGGTRWDANAESCILNKADIEKKVNDRIQILTGLVIAVEVAAAAGAGTVWVLLAGGGSVLTDGAFIGLDRLYELQPKKRAYEFVVDALNCEIPAGTEQCSSTQNSCASNVINQHFARLDEVLDDLNDEQLNSVGDAMENVSDCLTKAEYYAALMTSTPKFKDKVLASAGGLLLLSGIFFSPENAAAKLAKRAPKLFRVLSRSNVVERISSSLDNSKYMRLMIDKLDTNDIEFTVSELRKSGLYVSSNTTVDGERFLGIAERDIFGRWSKLESNWLNAVERSKVLRGISERLGGTYTVNDQFFYMFLDSSASSTGLNFHISVHPDYLTDATELVEHIILINSEKGLFANEVRVVLEPRAAAWQNQIGKEITLYVSSEGYDQTRIRSFVSQLEEHLSSNGILPGNFGENVRNGDKPVRGSKYMNYRYDRINERGIPIYDYNSNSKFVAPSAKYGGDIMDGIWVR